MLVLDFWRKWFSLNLIQVLVLRSLLMISLKNQFNWNYFVPTFTLSQYKYLIFAGLWWAKVHEFNFQIEIVKYLWLSLFGIVLFLFLRQRLNFLKIKITLKAVKFLTLVLKNFFCYLSLSKKNSMMVNWDFWLFHKETLHTLKDDGLQDQ